MNFYLLPSIELGPAIVERILRQIPSGRWDEALIAERFTPREVVAHLADWEPIMRDRIRTAVERPGAVIQPFDEGQMAIDHGYAETGPFDQCAVFARERAVTAQYIRSISEDQWPSSATHPERGRQTAEDLANLLLGHDLYHIEQLSAYLD